MIDSDPDLQNQDNRKSPRITIGVGVRIPHLQKKLICQNLSMTGCFLPASDLGPVGKILPILIDPPEIGLIPVEARIVHKGDDGKGTGLEFIAMEPEGEIRLSYFLDIFQK